MHRFDVTVSKELASAALRRFVFHKWRPLVAALLLCATSVGLDASDGELSTLSRAVAGTALAVVVIFGAAFVLRRRATWALLDRLDGPVTYSLTDEHLTTRSSLGENKLVWSAIRQVWLYPDVTLLFYDQSAFSRQFKATTGLTPSAYRTRAREA